MANWTKIIQGVAVIAAIIGVVIMVTSKNGPAQILAFAICGVVVLLYFRDQKKNAAINPVAEYFNTIRKDCTNNRAPNMGRLILQGDAHHQKLVKGKILGGPVLRYNKALLFKPGPPHQLEDAEGNKVFNRDGTPYMIEGSAEMRTVKDKDGNEVPDPRAEMHIFLYTPQFGFLYDTPILGVIPSMLWKKDYLFAAYKHQLESPTFLGDIVVKGVNSHFISGMEFIVDTTLDEDYEMKTLEEGSARHVLNDNMVLLDERIRYAVKASSGHLKELEMKDQVV